MYEKSGSEKGEKKGLGVPAGRAVPGGGGGECSPEEKQTSRCPETLYPSWMSESSSGDCQRLRGGKRGEAERCCGGTALRPQSRHGARGGGGKRAVFRPPGLWESCAWAAHGITPRAPIQPRYLNRAHSPASTECAKETRRFLQRQTRPGRLLTAAGRGRARAARLSAPNNATLPPTRAADGARQPGPIAPSSGARRGARGGAGCRARGGAAKWAWPRERGGASLSDTPVGSAARARGDCARVRGGVGAAHACARQVARGVLKR